MRSILIRRPLPNMNGSPNPRPIEPLSGHSLLSHVLQFRATYQETDGQGRVHHANYLNYFERGRVEMLRASGISYRRLEESGLLLVVIEMNVRYQSAARFDDLLTLTTELTEVRKVRCRHRYQLHREDELIVQAESVIACIDAGGNPRRLPQEFLELV